MNLLPAITGGKPLTNVVHHIDALELLRALPDASVDAIITDMPYGTTACAWDTVVDLAAWWDGVRRVLKPRGAFVTTASQPFTSALVMSNPEWFKYEWVWVKSRKTDFVNSKNKPLKQHENIVVFSGGTTANCSDGKMLYNPQGLKPSGAVKYRPNGTIATKTIGQRPSHVNSVVQDFTGYPSSVLNFEHGNNHNAHPTQKPVSLYEYLILTYTQPNAIVLDPFCGSGTTGVAARNTGRQYILGDITPEYVEIARARLALPYTLPMFDQEASA